MDTRFVLLTAAKNEEKYIEYALRSVVSQTVRPEAWYIVDDGSSDQTAEIIQDYSTAHPFIRLVQTGGARERSFGAQYTAINKAYMLAKDMRFDFVGMHDADIAFEDEYYFERIFQTFAGNSKLGITGGYIFERKANFWQPRKANSPAAVAGGIQMFRRKCFDEIGGYSPLLFGGEDWLAQLEAKRAGWNVLALQDLPAHHYRPTSSADGRIKGLFRLGMMDASFGSHPAFEVLKCAKRLSEKPMLVGSLVRFLGYLKCRVMMPTPLLPSDTVEYLRREQVDRLHNIFPLAGRITGRTN